MTKENKQKFAVIRTGGKQYKVSEGDILNVEKVEAKEKGSFEADILLFSDGGKVEIGTPIVSNAVVKATVLAQEKGDKVIVFKYKPKKNYRVKNGHRQRLTKVKIESISLKNTK